MEESFDSTLTNNNQTVISSTIRKSLIKLGFSPSRQAYGYMFEILKKHLINGTSPAAETFGKQCNDLAEFKLKCLNFLEKPKISAIIIQRCIFNDIKRGYEKHKNNYEELLLYEKPGDYELICELYEHIRLELKL